MKILSTHRISKKVTCDKKNKPWQISELKSRDNFRDNLAKSSLWPTASFIIFLQWNCVETILVILLFHFFFIFGNREILFLVVEFWHLNEWGLDQGLLWTHSHVSHFFTAETQFRLSGSWYRALEVAYGLIKVDRKHAESQFLCQNF